MQDIKKHVQKCLVTRQMFSVYIQYKMTDVQVYSSNKKLTSNQFSKSYKT